MINITNGRVKYEDGYGSSINCFLVRGGEETHIYQLEDSGLFTIVDNESFPAIQGEDYKSGGAWSSYNIESSKVLLFKFHITHKSPDRNEMGQFYFVYSPRDSDNKFKYVRSYTTNIVHKNDSIFENKVSGVVMGSCVFLPEKTLNSRGVKYNNRLCNDNKFREMMKGQNHLK